MSECLTRTGPLFEVKADELEPLPNLAKSWEWSEDGHELTMHLIEGAKWSDGDAVQRRRRDVLLGRQRPRSQRHAAERRHARNLRRRHDARRRSTTTRVKWTFKEAFPTQYLYAMAYGTFCPRPGAYPQAAASQVQRRQHLRPVQERLPARIHEHSGDGRLGAGRVPARRHHRDAPQPLLLEGRREGQPAALPQRAAVQALDLGRPRRAGRGRHRRLLQPRAGGKLSSRR